MEDTTARGDSAMVDRRRDAAWNRRRNHLRSLSGPPRRFAGSDRRAPEGIAMRIWQRIINAMEGVGMAIDSMKANRVRAALTIMGVAIGVFVVVAMSSVVRGINESFARDLEAAGPTSFYMYRRPISSFQACDGSDETCPERRNPPLTIDDAQAMERLPSIKAVTAHIGDGAKFTYKDKQVSTGMEIYTPNWVDVDGGDIYPGRSFTYAENMTGAHVIIVNEKLATRLFGSSDPIDKQIKVDGVQFRVIGVYHYTASPMGTPSSAGGGEEGGGGGFVEIMRIGATGGTREIGVRKALGATKSAILWQFLVGASTLTSIGAAIGPALGIGTALGIKAAFPAIPASTPVSAVVSA